MARKSKASDDDGHHGGAWKVAYADFVTAMMAFFLMMWLLNATTEDQRRGIADYFSPEIPVSAESGGGTNVLAGDSVTRSDTLPGVAPQEEGDTRELEANDTQFGEVRRDLEERLAEAGETGDLSEHVGVRLTDEGLIVDLFSLEDAPLFDGDGSEPTPLLEALVGAVDDVFALARNDIAISGYVSADPIVLRDSDPWSTSAARADQVRRLLSGGATGPERQARVTAHADRDPLHRDEFDVRNDRIELVLLSTR